MQVKKQQLELDMEQKTGSKLGKEFYQGCMLSPCLVNLYAEYTIRNDRLQQYVICELPDVQAGFRTGRGTRDQIANIHWIIEKAREFQ